MTTAPDALARPADWLAHLRVLQLDEHTVTSFAGHLLRLLGARVEVADRDRSRFEGPDHHYRFLNGAKPDASAAATRYSFAIAGPCAGGDGVTAPPGVPLAAACFDHGPAPAAALPELLLEAASGMLAITGDPGHEPFVPLKFGGTQLFTQAGVALAMLGLAAFRLAEGTGRAPHMELSIRQLGLALHNYIVRASYTGHDLIGRGVADSQPSVVFRCRDGVMNVSAPDQHQWQALCDYIGHPEIVDSAEFGTHEARRQHWEVLHHLIRDALCGRTAAEIMRDCGERSIPCVPVHAVDDLLSLEQLAVRQFWRASELDGRPLKAPSIPWTAVTGARREVPAPAPPPAAAPLAGVRVAETSWVWAGPFCTELLAWLGADVVKVESETRLDLFRRSFPVPDLVRSPNTAPSFNQLNMGKRSAAIDLQSPEGMSRFRVLLARSDVFVSNYRAGVLDALGLTDEVFRGVPGLVAARLTGFGPTGPWRRHVIYGTNACLVAGLGAYTGFPETLPVTPGYAMGDSGSGLNAALAIVAALVHRDATGEGALIDVSILEAMVQQATDAVVGVQVGAPMPRLGNRHQQYVPHGVFACGGEDQWVALAACDDSQWQALAALIGAPAAWHGWDAAARRQHEDAIDVHLAAWATTHATGEDAAGALLAAGVPTSAAPTPGRLLRDPLLLGSGFLREVDHPAAGAKLMTGAPWLADGQRPPHRRAPLLGEHTTEVLADLP